MLFKVILSLEAFTANFTTKGHFGTLVCPFMNHQIVWFGEPPLAVFANKFAL